MSFGWDLDTFIFFGGYPGAAPFIGDEERWRAYIQDAVIETTVSRDILLMTRIDKPALRAAPATPACPRGPRRPRLPPIPTSAIVGRLAVLGTLPIVGVHGSLGRHPPDTAGGETHSWLTSASRLSTGVTGR